MGGRMRTATVCLLLVASMAGFAATSTASTRLASEGTGQAQISSGQALGIVSTTPAANAEAVTTLTHVQVVFTEAVNPATIHSSSFAVYSSLSGLQPGSYSVVGATVEFTPAEPFEVGERVSVTVTTAVASMAGSNLSAPRVWSFTVRGGASACDFIPGGEYDPGYKPLGPWTADFNGDDLPDIAMTYYGGTDSIFVFFNDGAGWFVDGPRLAVAGTTSGPVILDLEADGDADMAVFCNGDYETLLRNDGSGNFSRTDIGFDPPTTGSLAADFNGDGYTDIAGIGYVDSWTTRIHTLLNDGAGNLIGPFVSEFGDSYYGYLMQAHDCDSDGDVDLIQVVRDVTVLLNDGDGNFVTVVSSADLPYQYVSMDVGDLNGDGYVDVVAGSGHLAPLVVLLNSGDNTFSIGYQYSLSVTVNDIDLADLNGDGTLDAALTVVYPGNHSLLIMKGLGGGQFEIDDYYAADNYPFSLDLADYDNDGRIDAVINNTLSDNLSVRFNETCFDYDGDYYGDLNKPQNTCPDDNCPSIYNPDQTDSDVPPDGIGDACTFATPVPSGSSQYAEFVAPGMYLRVEFPYVFSPGGEASLEVVGTGPGVPPTGIQLIPSSTPIYYDISVDFSFNPPVRICIEYDDAGMTPEQEALLVMEHWFAGEWDALTVDFHDPEYNFICASSNTLSPFALAYPLPYICGDANGSGGDPAVDIDDVVYLINYIFAGGPAPEPVEAGDADCSGGDVPIDIDDVVYLINYIFAGGPAPCADCP
jgi:hypothetical protein